MRLLQIVAQPGPASTAERPHFVSAATITCAEEVPNHNLMTLDAWQVLSGSQVTRAVIVHVDTGRCVKVYLRALHHCCGD
jgi:hypothetical protein